MQRNSTAASIQDNLGASVQQRLLAWHVQRNRFFWYECHDSRVSEDALTGDFKNPDSPLLLQRTAFLFFPSGRCRTKLDPDRKRSEYAKTTEYTILWPCTLQQSQKKQTKTLSRLRSCHLVTGNQCLVLYWSCALLMIRIGKAHQVDSKRALRAAVLLFRLAFHTRPYFTLYLISQLFTLSTSRQGSCC